MYNFQISKVYSFNTLAPSILGVIVKNAKLLGILSYNAALAYDNIDLKYRTIYPLLPSGTPDAPESCIYYQFKSESGEKIIIADQWIEESTIEVINHINFQVLFTEASIEDISRVRDSLNALGYTNYQIKQL